mgnify:CR=1 FL=1
MTTTRKEALRSHGYGVSRRLAARIARHWHRTTHEIVEIATKRGLYWARFGDGERVQGAIRHLGK